MKSPLLNKFEYPLEPIYYNVDNESLLFTSMDVEGNNYILYWNISSTLKRYDSPLENRLITVSHDIMVISTPNHNLHLIHENSASLLQGHTDSIIDVIINPQLNLLLSSSLDNTVKVWDLSTSHLITSIPHNNTITSLKFIDNSSFMTSTVDGYVHFWSIPSYQINDVIYLSNPYNEELLINSYLYNHILTSIYTGSPSIKIFDISSKSILKSVSRDNLDFVVFNQNMAYKIAYGLYNNILIEHLLDTSISFLRGHTDDIIDIFIYPDNSKLLSSSKDKSFILWDLSSNSIIKRIPVNNPFTLFLNVSPDLSKLFTFFYDYSNFTFVFELWDLL